MITFSTIQKSQLEGAHRLDAEYYQPEYLDLVSKIKSQKSKLLKDFSNQVFSGPFGSMLKSESYQDDGIPFIRIGDISDIFISRENLVHISDDEHKRIFSTHLDPGDIVLSKIGTVGRLSVISDELGQVNISENNIGIRLSTLSVENRVSLLFFLLSRYGQSQILRNASGNIQLKLNVADIENISIPVFSKQFEKELHNFYQEIIELRNSSDELYHQSEKLLLEELDLRDFDFEKISSSIVNFSEILEARRIDAEYFQPKYAKLISNIESKEYKRLGDLVSIKKGIEIGAEQYQDEGKIFIRVSSMGKFEINGGNQKYLSEKLYEELKDTFQPQVEEILLTKDATPGIAYVLKENIEGIISGGTLRLKLKEKIEAEYLALCLNSIIGQMQAERDAGGSVIAHWKPEQIKNVVIPILPTETQQKIADLVRQSHEARKKAKELLDEAKRKVEEMIENK